MTTLQSVLSWVQSNVGDIALDHIQRAEYLDFADAVGKTIAKSARAWVNDVTVIPIPSLDYTYDDDAARQAAVSFVPADVGKMAYVTEDGTWWRLDDDAPITWTAIDPYVAIVPAAVGMHKILRSTRNNIPASEVSLQAVGNAQDNNYPFPYNRIRVPYATFATLKKSDESLEVRFVVPFEIGTEFYAEGICTHPFAMDRWTETTQIPDYLDDVFKYGILFMVAQRLYYQGTEHMQNRFMIAQREYKQMLVDAVAYSRRLLDEQSNMEHKPFIWLPE